MQLLAKLKSGNKKVATAAEKEIFNLLNTDKRLRSKRELIEEFIESNMPHIKDTDTIPEEFTKYWDEKQKQAFETLVKEEKLILESTQNLIDNYLYAEREPLRDEVLALLEGEQPTLLKRKSTGDRILKRILDFVETFIEGMV